MPPKGSVKAKANASKAPASKEPATPQSKGKGEEETPKQTPKTGSAVKPRGRKSAKESVKPFNALPSSGGNLAPIDISFENDTVNGKPLEVGGYGQDVRLRAHQPFSLVSSVMLIEGQYAGYQAVLLKPSAPFPFLKLPDSVRARICRYYFAPAGKTNGKIDIAQTSNGLLSAKAYAAEAKPRLALLCVNKEILELARPILYSYTLRFDKADTVLSFLTCAGEKVRSLLTSIDITVYAKAKAMPMMTIMSECKNIQRVHIAGGVGVNQTPDKAAKQFYTDAHRFLQVMGTIRGDKCAGIDLLSFGDKCFTIKDDDGDLVEWDDDEVDDFTAALKHKLQ